MLVWEEFSRLLSKLATQGISGTVVKNLSNWYLKLKTEQPEIFLICLGIALNKRIPLNLKLW